ncbi:immunoglobulin-like and fibronectin type III domain-containing protein 1 isoform X4 [Erpetoichthys calabaricus]|uniref:immunoglobulin-like and fibronectin type III domain-containing protein 1 isoform X4 n=1 Tax=Erpetoichthys calabaricus TaxID=27687 RepID=UPI0022348F75|nr:immunoglobulin-like and fibronectin type III domain-containing protein 1 isoform X4 [Erpetoichthys calabaricus]
MSTSKMMNGSASEQANVIKKSKMPGVKITQYTEDIPPGCSSPDFDRKPIPLTIQEGKTATFKAIICGEPKAQVTWSRNKGDMNDGSKYKITYDQIMDEHVLQVISVTGEDADTYKCSASNLYGEAVCFATLIVIEIGFKKKAKPKSQEAVNEDPTEFRKLLKKRSPKEGPSRQQKALDSKVWEVLLSADKKDYERICIEYGITDFRGMLKKLNQLKKEREEEQSKFVEAISNLKHIQVTSEGSAKFEIEMQLKDENSRILLYKDGQMIPYSEDMEMKHNLRKVGKKYIFSIRDLLPEDAGLYQVDVEEVNVFSTDLPSKFIPINFTSPMKEVHCKEREDAFFEVTLSHPLPKLVWMYKNQTLEAGDKYGFTVSEDGLTHRLIVKDVMPVDKGIYSVAAGIRSSSAWLMVENLGAHFVSGLMDVQARKGHSAELVCKLSSDQTEGMWFKDGVKLQSRDGLAIYKDGCNHKLILSNVQDSDAGKYRFEADGHKSESYVVVEDPPEIDAEEMEKLSKVPVVVKAGQNAVIKVPFQGRAPMKVSWYKDGDELAEDHRMHIEKGPSHSRLLIGKCQRKDSGDIKLKLKNDSGTAEVATKLIVLDKPLSPQGPVEVLENSASCIQIKWRPPRDDGGQPINSYTVERQQVGRNTWVKVGEVPGSTTTFTSDKVDHGKKYCFRIRAVNSEGVSDFLETEDITAGTKAFPGPPAPPKIVSASSKAIALSWGAPHNTGGSRIAGYVVEKRKKGSNLWTPVSNEPLKEKKCVITDIVEGSQYEFQVAAVNESGMGEFSVPSNFVIAQDPMRPPSKVKDLKVTGSSYSSLSLSWAKPDVDEGDEAKGYFVEVKPANSITWLSCNSAPVSLTSYTIKGLKSMEMYFVRVTAVNDGGRGEPQELDNYVIAMPPPVRPHFLQDASFKSFMVVKEGSTIRVNIHFEASPTPEVIWMKDNVPITKRATITNTDGLSQLLIPTSDRTDSGIYSIMIKNCFGQESLSLEIRVTDEPKPPGLVTMEEKVPGTVTVFWEPSPDEKYDNRLHYMVMKRDSFKLSWQTMADHIFNNKITATSIICGRQYYFRVYAKNDMGVSEPSESPAWNINKEKDKFTVKLPHYKQNDQRQAPRFSVGLKTHYVPLGYQCNMSCAVMGNPAPRVTWYRDSVSIMKNADYQTSNVCGVCSLIITGVRPKDNGEYMAIAENSLGKAICTTRLIVIE